MKKIIAGVVIGSFVLAGTTFAEEVEQEIVHPTSEVYGLVRAMEKIELALTESPAQRALIQLDLLENRETELETIVEEGHEETITGNLDEQEEYLENIEEELERVVDEEELSEIEETIEEKLLKRQQRIDAKRGLIPQQAIAGMERALENFKNAKRKAIGDESEESAAIVVDVVVEDVEETVEVAAAEEEAGEVTEEVKETTAIKTEEKKAKGNERAAQAREKAAEKANKGKQVEQKNEKQHPAAKNNPGREKANGAGNGKKPEGVGRP